MHFAAFQVCRRRISKQHYREFMKAFTNSALIFRLREITLMMQMLGA